MARELITKMVAAAIVCAATAAGGRAQTATRPLNGKTIQQRKQIQQDRIAQGVKSGQLRARQTARLESREASINREERAMRRKNNGRLTKADRAALTKRQNHVSHAIYKDKHNAAHQ